MSAPLYEALDIVEEQMCHGCPQTPGQKAKSCYLVRFPSEPDGESVLCVKCLDRLAQMKKRARKGRAAQPTAAQPAVAQVAKPNGPAPAAAVPAK